MNLYAYVGNDPVNMVDPTGKVMQYIIPILAIGYGLYDLWDNTDESMSIVTDLNKAKKDESDCILGDKAACERHKKNKNKPDKLTQDFYQQALNTGQSGCGFTETCGTGAPTSTSDVIGGLIFNVVTTPSTTTTITDLPPQPVPDEEEN